VPEDLQAALEAEPAAKTFFASINASNRYAILWRIQTAARAETRARRIAQLVGCLPAAKPSISSSPVPRLDCEVRTRMGILH
jgi:uncharacterized protein YdeI (YjbR/CyaY-like superfamily)